MQRISLGRRILMVRFTTTAAYRADMMRSQQLI